MKNTVSYSDPFVPAELIAAHGLTPRRFTPKAESADGGRMSAPGVCPYMRAFVEEAIGDEQSAGIIVSTGCDQMRRARDIIGQGTKLPTFLLNVPHTWQATTPHKMYRSELERLSRFLVSIGGSAPSPEKLRSWILEYDNNQQTLRNARAFLSPLEYSLAIKKFREEGALPEVDGKDIVTPSGAPVAIVGGPMMSGKMPLFEMIEKCEGYVALDATESGERTIPAPIDRRMLDEDPLQAISDAYFGSIPDAFRRPNSGLYQWMSEKMAEREIRGIIFRRYVWCDTWSAEAFRMKEWAKIPLLQLDVNDDDIASPRTLTRIQAFMETVIGSS